MSATPAASLTTTTPPPERALEYASPQTPAPHSDWSPLRNKVFLALWLASAVSYIGFEIRNYAAPLLMKDFGAGDDMAGLTQMASTLPSCILALIAGALADILDRRILLIVTHIWMLIVAGTLGLLTLSHHMTPGLLLAFLMLIGSGFAMMNPVFLAVLPELVQPSELRSALALNSVSLNIARVMGPAIGGVIVASIGGGVPGKGAAFLATAISLGGVVIVVWLWKPAVRQKPRNPESVSGAVRTGLRYAWFSPRLRAVLVRVLLFITCAAVLPGFLGSLIGKILVREGGAHVKLGDTAAAIMMVSLGVGAICGVYFMQPFQRKLGVERSVTLCTITYGLAMLGVAFAPFLFIACAAMAVAGFNWVIIPTNFNIATQLAVPGWVKGRAMSMYSAVLYGSFALGGIIFGKIARHVGPRMALAYAGMSVLAGTVFIIWFRLVPKGKEDFTPSKHWPEPIVAAEPEREEGPVMVTVEYRVDPERATEFSNVMHKLRLQRLRGGAHHWGVYNAAATPGRFIETFIVRSWVDHLRQHDRMTKADAMIEEQARSYHLDSEPPLVSHWLHAPAPLNGGAAEKVCWLQRADEWMQSMPATKRLRDRIVDAWALHEERLRARETRP